MIKNHLTPQIKNRIKKLLGNNTMYEYNLNYEKKIEETKKHLSKIIQVDVDKIHELDLDDVVISYDCILIIREKLFEFISGVFETTSPMLIMTKPYKYINQFSFWVEEGKKIILFWQTKENTDVEFVFQIPEEGFQVSEIKKSLIN